MENLVKKIESALTGINDAKFQDLINHLLYLEGYKFIGAPGSVVGKEKTSKGTPDSFFQDGENYVFVECTTQEKLKKGKKLLQKLLDDIDHCFSTGSGVPCEKIATIIIACTSKILPEEIEALKSKVAFYHAEAILEIFNIQNLPFKLLKHPRLVDRYLGIRTVKGEIFNLPEYLLRSSAGLQPSLVNEFVGREEILTESIGLLARKRILLFSGPSGTGKSKLAVRIMERSEAEGYQGVVILGSVVPLWEDFLDFFQAERRYLVLLDDANKSIKNFSYMLSFMDRPENANIKLIITCRDYVKAEVLKELRGREYEEVIVGKLKDEDISEIITKAVPALRYHDDIRRRIIGLSKGNARMAMMAAYSVMPDAENNYLRSPVLLYEKYFEKLSFEIEAFKKPMTLRALGIVSFFDQIRRDDMELRERLSKGFGIKWDELWKTIETLHEQEVLDIYNETIVKVSDQVLSTFAFYKCFIDPDSARLNYGDWVLAFSSHFSYRIESTLIDVNNTFTYEEVRGKVVPHLDKVMTKLYPSDLYSFFSIFWFYKSMETLAYVKKWLKSLEITEPPENLQFSFPHNEYNRPGKYFELLVNFWNHGTEFLVPSLKIAIDMVATQPERLGVFLKYLEDRFKYTFEDTENGYIRQQKLVDVLANEDHTPLHKEIATGGLLYITEHLLGWSFHQVGSADGRTIQIRNFDLVANEDLQKLRAVLLSNFYNLFEVSREFTDKILNKIVYPGGNIDKKIYDAEVELYNKFIIDKLSSKSLSHCKFVKGLIWRLKQIKKDYPEAWNRFLNSETMVIYNFMYTDFEDREGKGWQEIEDEKKKQIEGFVASNDWAELEKFLFRISDLLEDYSTTSQWQMNAAISQLYFAIAAKGKNELVQALRLALSGRLTFKLSNNVLGFALRNEFMSGQDLIALIEDSKSVDREWHISYILEAMPADQCTIEMMRYLVPYFKTLQNPITVYHMADWDKYQAAFIQYAEESNEKEFKDHNFITFLTQLILSDSKGGKASLGYSFCEASAQHFRDHLPLLKQAYYYNKEHGLDRDYDGKEFESILKLDIRFFIEYIGKEAENLEIELIRGSAPNVAYVWRTSDYHALISEALELLADKYNFGSYFEHAASMLFTLHDPDEAVRANMLAFIADYTSKFYYDKKKMSMIMNISIHKFPESFVDNLRNILLKNKDYTILKVVDFRNRGIMEGSHVPYIQKEIAKCDEVVQMIKGLPDVMEYYDHLQYMEKYIGSLEENKAKEQQRDFLEY